MKYPFGTITITRKTKDLVNKILDSGRISGGKYVREFETKFAKLVGTKEAVALSSGTDADALALAVLYDFGAKRNDEVIVPALSFVATGNAVLQAGFVPKFVDIDVRTLNIDPSKIEKAITRKTKAIMPVHLMGKPADMDKINRIARKHKLLVVEDAAEAQSATYKGREIGTLGDMAAFSLYIAHVISTGEGGLITTDHARYAEILWSSGAWHCNAPRVCSIPEWRLRQKIQTQDRHKVHFRTVGCQDERAEAAIGLAIRDLPEIFRNGNRISCISGKAHQPDLLTIDPTDEEWRLTPPRDPSKGLKFTRDGSSPT